jgi:hypothetical protein
MATDRTSETAIRREVERMFAKISARRGDPCINPVTGGEFVYGSDPIKKQKDAAYKRLLVREYLALNGPPDAPRMPTDERDRGRAKYAGGLLGFITAQFLWSLENQHDLTVHPSFADFASGLLWQHENMGGCTALPFTPQQLPEMDCGTGSRSNPGPGERLLPPTTHASWPLSWAPACPSTLPTQD